MPISARILFGANGEKLKPLKGAAIELIGFATEGPTQTQTSSKTPHTGRMNTSLASFLSNLSGLMAECVGREVFAKDPLSKPILQALMKMHSAGVPMDDPLVYFHRFCTSKL